MIEHDTEPPPDWEPEITVILPCNLDRVPERSVKTLDIAEDFEGRDVLTFECPECGQVHTSHRYG